MEGIIRMKKVVILVGLLFLITGCSVKYYVDIDEDLDEGHLVQNGYINQFSASMNCQFVLWHGGESSMDNPRITLSYM